MHDPVPGCSKKEAKLLAGAAALTIVSPTWGSIMSEVFGVGAKIHVVPNGYDAEEMLGVEPHDFGHFAIVYTGSFYPPKRVITPVMAALGGIKETTNGKYADWYFHYYGKEENHVREEAAKYGVIDRVVLHGNVARSEALSAVRGANIAVVVTSIEKLAKEDAGMIPAKLFESLGLQTPTLIVGPPGGDIDSITEMGGLARRFASGDIHAIRSFIVGAISGEVFEPEELHPYTWQAIGEKLNHILRATMDGPPDKERRYATDLVTSYR
jgi:glycosyltransferase involved in cell wall biosynthesis